MINYIKSVMVFSLLAGLMFLATPQGYLSSDEAEGLTIDQKKVNAAVDKGVAFLLKRGIKGQEMELMVLTLLHAGLDPKRDKDLRAALSKLTTGTLSTTYRVALTAMALEKADHYKYQSRIAECAHALVNYQCENGQWNYDARYNRNFPPPRKTRESVPIRKAIITGKKKSRKTKALRRIIIERHEGKRGAEGDNSNTQFALLGLYAAARCGIQIPKETWEDAMKYLEEKAQLGDGGWCYVEPGRPITDWTIHSYGSMVCACLCGLAIAKHHLDPTENLLKNESIKKGLNWLATRLTFDRNPGGVPWAQWESLNGYLYYYIYGVERVGAILGIKKIGRHDWYPEGAEYLLEQQAENGSWDYTEDSLDATIDTCFAILFLKKATPPLKFKAIISGESNEPGQPDNTQPPDDE